MRLGPRENNDLVTYIFQKTRVQFILFGNIFWRKLEAILIQSSWSALRALRNISKAPWSILDASLSLQKQWVALLHTPNLKLSIYAVPQHLLKASWMHWNPQLRRLEALFSLLEESLGRLEASWGLLEASGVHMVACTNIDLLAYTVREARFGWICFNIKFWKRLEACSKHLEASWKRLEAVWMRCWACANRDLIWYILYQNTLSIYMLQQYLLKLSWSVFKSPWSVSKAPWSILKAPWSILDASWSLQQHWFGETYLKNQAFHENASTTPFDIVLDAMENASVPFWSVFKPLWNVLAAFCSILKRLDASWMHLGACKNIELVEYIVFQTRLQYIYIYIYV